MTTVFQPKYDGLKLVEMLGDASEDYGLSPKEQQELIQELARAYRELLVTKPSELPKSITGAILDLANAAAVKLGKLHTVVVDDSAFDRICSECKYMARIAHGLNTTRSLDLVSTAGKVVVVTKEW